MPVIEPERITLANAAEIAGVSRRALQQAAQAWDAGRHGLETIRRYVSADDGQLFEGLIRLTTRDWLDRYVSERRQHRYTSYHDEPRHQRWGSVELYRWRDEPDHMASTALWRAAEQEARRCAATPRPVVVQDRDASRHEDLRAELATALGLDDQPFLMREFRTYPRTYDDQPPVGAPMSWIVVGMDEHRYHGMAVVRRRGF